MSSSGNTITKAAVRLRLKFEPIIDPPMVVEPKPTFQKGLEAFEDSTMDLNMLRSHRFDTYLKRSNFAQMAGLDSVTTHANEFATCSFCNTASVLFGNEDYNSFAMKPLKAGIVDHFLICGPSTDDDGNLQLASDSEFCIVTDSGIENFER